MPSYRWMLVAVALPFVPLGVLNACTTTGGILANDSGPHEAAPVRAAQTKVASAGARGAAPAANAIISANVSVTMSARIGIPRGSALNLVLRDAGGRPVETIQSKVEAGPPYPVAVSVPASTQFPLTVEAELVSLNGHRLTGSATVASKDSFEGGQPIVTDVTF